jgi:hypothetical protein
MLYLGSYHPLALTLCLSGKLAKVLGRQSTELREIGEMLKRG